MIKVEMSPNDQKDILDLLDYALRYKELDNDKESPYKYWEIRIPQLKAVINGLEPYEPNIQSTMYGYTRIWTGKDEKEDMKFFNKVRKGGN